MIFPTVTRRLDAPGRAVGGLGSHKTLSLQLLRLALPGLLTPIVGGVSNPGNYPLVWVINPRDPYSG